MRKSPLAGDNLFCMASFDGVFHPWYGANFLLIFCEDLGVPVD